MPGLMTSPAKSPLTCNEAISKGEVTLQETSLLQIIRANTPDATKTADLEAKLEEIAGIECLNMTQLQSAVLTAAQEHAAMT